jgi:hypothetical protein
LRSFKDLSIHRDRRETTLFYTMLWWLWLWLWRAISGVIASPLGIYRCNKWLVRSACCLVFVNFIFLLTYHNSMEELDGPAVSALGVRSLNLSNVHKGQTSDGWPKFIILRASEGTLSCWYRLHLQSLTPPPVSRRVDVRQAADRKNNCQFYSQHDLKNMLYRPHLVG